MAKKDDLDIDIDVADVPRQPPQILVKSTEDPSITQLRRAYADLWNRISFVEARVDESEKWLNVRKKQEQEKEMAAFTQQYVDGMALQPSQSEDRKLPVRYSDKAFPFISLPLFKGLLMLRRAYRRVASYIVSPDPSVDGTRKAIREANEERNVLNIIRLQREIHKVQRALSKAIRNNHETMVMSIGYYTNDVMIIAYALKKHFEEVGYKDVKVTTNRDAVFLHIDIEY